MIYFLAPMARAQPRSVIDIRDAATRDENMKLVRDAVKKHQQLAPESARGEDVDYLVRCSHVSSRSFFFSNCFTRAPLCEAILDASTRKLWNDPIFIRSSDMTLFTSNLFNRHIRSFGFSTLNKEGVGNRLHDRTWCLANLFCPKQTRNTHVRINPCITYSSRLPLTARCPMQNLQSSRGGL